MPLQRILTDRGTEVWGAPERRTSTRAVEDTHHTRTKTRPAERDLRTLPEDLAGRVLSDHVSQEDVAHARGAAGGSGSLRRALQCGATAPGTLVLRKDADADVPGQRAAGEGEVALARDGERELKRTGHCG